VFDAADVRVDGIADTPLVRYRLDEAATELHAQFVAGCEGFHGVCRTLVGPEALDTWEREYPFAWLGILADVPPSTDELIHARHAHGFALHSMRSETVSRLYHQVAPDEDPGAWSDDRSWDELSVRLHADGFALPAGPIRDKSVTPMRSFVAAPMRHGRRLLVGDAAHIVPATGAKGLNLAVADAALLADALDAHYATGSDTGLDEYSDRCLRRVWRAQHSSWWMTSMLHVDPRDDAYGAELARSLLRYVCSSAAAATTLAENYVGRSHEFAARRARGG
jgi:p-hydroxybenzoate 3-monooxygenase